MLCSSATSKSNLPLVFLVSNFVSKAPVKPKPVVNDCAVPIYLTAKYFEQDCLPGLGLVARMRRSQMTTL